MKTGALVLLVAAVCLGFLGAPVFADDPPNKQDSPVGPLLQQFIGQREDTPVQGSQQSDSGAFTRSLSNNDLTIKDAAASATVTTGSSDTSDDPVRFDSSGNVQVYIHLDNADDDTLQQLRDLGADIEITNSDANIVQAWVPTAALDAIAALDAVDEITAPDYGQTKTGRVNTEGDGIHRADLVRAFSGLNGSGVKVGVISDGVDSWTSARSSRDLPSSIEINPDLPGSGDEGTALLEIIHDLAPGADLAFSGAGSSLGFVEATLWLANDAFDGEGADVIVDDLGYYLEPYFEDGLVALAAADAVAGGAVFASAAGNYASGHYTGGFSDDGNGYHDFDDSGATDIALSVELGSSLILQWNDQFGSSGNDYDLFVCPPGLKPVKFNLQNGVCESSTREQDGDDDPYERIFTLFPYYSKADVYIRKFSGSARQLKLFVAHGEVLEHGNLEGGIIGHPAVSGVLAVGAIAANDPGHDDARYYSDRGQTEIYFPRETRPKPDVMGIDGVTVSGAGGFGVPIVGISGSRFYGTSAAAPHVAGIAALVMEAQRKANPSMTKKAVADAVAQTLRDTAVDIGDQDSNGYSTELGYGRADALAAIESLAGSDTLDLYSSTPFTNTHTVNSTGDGADSDTSDGVCDDGTVDGSTNCTLRAAIQQTNAGTGATIEFNISGGVVQTISPASALPAITRPVFIDGYSQSGASAGTLLIELDGASAGTGANGLTITGQGSVVRGLVVNSFDGNGIVLQGTGGGHVIAGNYIGTDDSGATDEGNGAAGVYINGAPKVVLRDNVISGNTTHGVRIRGSAAKRAVIFGNTIGLNAAGTADLGNTMAGVYVDGAEEAVLRDNVISGNDTHGISLSGSGARNADIQYNRIGTNAAGTTDLGNTGSGIHISGARNTGIYENVIGGNDSHGISLTGSGARDTFIGENYIGANSGGTDLGNSGSGVHIANSSYNNFVEVNTIAYNTGDGVTVTASGTSLGNTIWQNSIHDNDGDGIDLGNDGPTTNDTDDSDSGPNHLQNYPHDITFATRGDIASVQLQLHGTANQRYVFDFYACDSSTTDEGKTWLGSTTANWQTTAVATRTASTLLGNFHDFTGTTATHITATATDRHTNSTSEFAPCVARTDLPELTISKTEIEVTEGDMATYTVSLPSAPSADLTVNLAVDNSSVATVSPTEITFTSTDFSETVTVTPVADSDADNEATEVRHLVTIGDNEYMTAIIPVEVTDDDAPGLVIESTDTTATIPTDASVGHLYDARFGSDLDNRFYEGATATYTVALTAEPDEDTTINLSSSDTGALTVSPSSITFTKTGEDSDPNKFAWDSAQTVTLTAVSDSDAAVEREDVSHEMTINGRDYVLGRVHAAIQDTGLPLLTFTPETREVTIASEGANATYTIQMNAEPTGDVTVDLTSSDTDSVSVSPSSITFTKTGEASDPNKFEWNALQTVTVTGVADGDEFDDIAFISHHTTFDGDDVSWPSVLVTVTDSNRAPFFEDGLTTTRDVPENSMQGAEVGAPITAADLNTGDTLTYTLDDPSGLFEIDSNGQIKVSADDSLDYEGSDQDYSMDVTVTDTGGLEDKIDVKVLVTDVNEPPEITGDESPEFSEDASVTTRVARYTATDPENHPINWTVAGSDGSSFKIDSSGNLRFNNQPNHEDKDTYNIEIVAGNPPPNLSDLSRLTVQVTVLDVDEPPEISGDTTFTFDEGTATATILDTYTAVDPEGATSTFSWTLGGADSGDFTINTNGQLQFLNVPDFERPADSGRNNEYNVQLRANDGSKTGTLDVSITVQDVNEPPTVTGDAALSFPENTATTRVLDRYAATDPERRPLTWSLNSRSGSDADAFRIDTSGNLYFDGKPDHESPTDSGANNVYDIRVVATDDGNLGDSTPQGGNLHGMFDVTVTVTPVDEPPVVTGTTTFDNWQENTSASTPIHTYTATDPEGATFTWTLGGSDRNDFTFTNGTLTFANAPDHERPADSGGNNHYKVILYATDATNKRGELHVDILVQNVDEPPEISGPDTVNDFPENSATSRQVGRYTATDPEGATATLTLTGTHSDDLNLASNGVVTFKASPDYEEQTTYSFNIRAVAGTHTVNLPVTVNIQNVEEPGAVTLSTVQPQETTSITATLEDDDSPTGTTWQWYRTSSRGSTGTAITNADSATYTPVGDDVGFYLRAVASYNDGFDDGNTAVAVSVNRALALNPDNVRPEFPAGGDYTRSIRENLSAPRNLGSPLTATDANSSDRLTYSIPASDFFEINQSTGLLRTKTTLDYETQPTHTITVTATDPGNLRITVDVAITVEDVDETPQISSPANRSTVEFPENDTSPVDTYTATDPDRHGIEWMLRGPDDDAFTLIGSDSTRTLVFATPPDFEEKNTYRITIEAREQSPGTSVARLNVTVRVANVEEPGMVVVPVSEPRVGQQLTPTVEDLDGGVGSIEWKWERRDPLGDWSPIPGATSRSYTPSRDDNGKELRVVAIYRDREGPGKTHTHQFEEPVVLRPYFDSDRATRSIQENTPADRDVGSRFTARHPDNVNLTYSVGGSDQRFFDIDNNGQLKTSATPLDSETLSDHQAEVEITATAPDSETATITVTVTVTNECTSSGEPPCAPRTPSVSSASDTSLRVAWSTPGTPSGTPITGYELQYRINGTNDTWTPQFPPGTDRAHTIENLVKDTTYEVQVRATNGNGTSEWSQSGTGTAGFVPPPPPPPPPPVIEEETTTTTNTGTGGGGSGGGGSFSFGGGGGGGVSAGQQRPPALVGPQAVTRLFAPLLENGTLERVWRFNNEDKSWTFYDPRPIFAQFNTLRLVRPPVILIVKVTRAQVFRGERLNAGWNFINVR